MGLKPIQDIAPPLDAANPPTEPLSGPEVVNDIPVRAPTEQAGSEQELPAAKDDDLSFILPTTSPSTTKKEKPQTKDSQPKPTLAIVTALLATACLAAGAYLKFFAGRLG